MNNSDRKLIKKALEVIENDTLHSDSTSNLASSLLEIRDNLTFKDDEWYRQYTDEVVTLDSAGNFVPKTSKEKDQVSAAVDEAIDSLKNLLTQRCSQSLTRR